MMKRWMKDENPLNYMFLLFALPGSKTKLLSLNDFYLFFPIKVRAIKL